MGSFDKNRFFIVGGRPVRLRVHAWGVTCEAFDWISGEMLRDNGYRMRVLSGEGDVEEVSEQAFETAVAERRAEIAANERGRGGRARGPRAGAGRDPGPPPDLRSLLDEALAMTDERLARTAAGSVHNMYASVRNQLQFMRDAVASGRSPSTTDKNQLTLGVIAAREFETSDPEYGDAIARAAYEFRKR